MNKTNIFRKAYKQDSKWKLDESDDQGVLIKTHEFDTQKQAQDFIKSQIDKVQKDSLNDLLAGDDDSDLPVVQKPQIPAFRSHEPLDQQIVKTGAERKAKSLMNSLLKIYLSKDIIDNNEFVQAKAALDTMTLQTLIGQIQKVEHALDVMLSDIDSGAARDRTFEVYGGLQKTLLELMKHQTLHLHAMSEGAKKIKNDIDIYSDMKIVSEEPEKASSGPQRGSKNMMRDIQERIDAERQSENADFKEIPDDEDK